MEQTRELFAVCHVNDVAKRRAVGYVLARVDENGKTVPFPVVITRFKGKYYGYVNRCPHQGTRLDFEPRQFLDSGLQNLMCGKHGALFDIPTGHCNDGPCKGERLEPVEVVIDNEEVCITGVILAEEDGLDREENDEMPEIVIQPD
ncbi:Rieske (2Fe-2S) protein [Methylocystis heyeri]|uniref:Rieske 2Fe-2S domain-containing protein n=1 Tax=Methylocystis heyeri TaxID=391905 RepID=A0A6B8KKC0_9HYPH|nr:Rieske 2Fe-2S domain-containing protein [Methylocystis heyeri]QGM47345.1 Rieske 2Fe-2S domain-containing protein [Methylocystis heyeri]